MNFKNVLNQSCPWLAAMCFVLSFGLQTQCAAQERMLSFPEDIDYATLVLFEPPTIAKNLTGFARFNQFGESVGKATGEVSVPEGSFVGLKIVAREGYLDLLASLAGQEIGHIEISGPALCTDLFRHFGKIEGLRYLKLQNCSIGDQTGLEDSQGAGTLQSFSYYLNSKIDEGKQAATQSHVANWASKCSQLQFFNSADELQFADLKLFSRHESPLFISIALRDDSNQIIEALGNIPNLVGLNLRVANNVPADFHRDLKKLRQLELFNWSGGDLDNALVESLSQMERLRTVRFQGRIRVTDEFIAGLAKLNKLESISFNTQLSDTQKAMLSEALMKMEGIREFPEISNPSMSNLSQLKKRGNLKTIELAGLGEDATPSMVAEVIRANPDLQRIELSQLDFTPELGEVLASCLNLQHLSLSVFDFDASWIKNPESLVQLQSMNLSVNGAPRNLDALARFPKLDSMQISLKTLDPEDWSFVADSNSLHNFSILDGYCDDSIVKWISKNKNLGGFTTVQDCVMTDAGVNELCECEHLTSLSIGGFISAECIEKLAGRKNITRLSIRSDLPNEADKERLEKQFKHLHLLELHPTAGPIVIGDDNLYRRSFDEGRDKFDAMEGKSLEEILGDALTEDLKKQLKDKVVLVEFWGTWCRPCLNFVPELERLQNQYGADGFQIVAVHSQAKAETAEQYMKEHPKPWPNLTDEDGSLEKSFEVPLYPSLYLFGKDGKLRIAQPHRTGLDRSLQQLLSEEIIDE